MLMGLWLTLCRTPFSKCFQEYLTKTFQLYQHITKLKLWEQYSTVE
jgi:hypothetical protein